MSVKFANNAFGTLNAGINNSATSLTLSSGQGARFPTLASGEYFYATLIDTSNNLEVVKCTARATDVLTVTRAQESTTAQAFSIGDRIELRVTAQGLDDAANPYDKDTSSTGSLALPVGTTAQAPTAANTEGHIRYDSDNDSVYYSNGTTWLKISATVALLTSVSGNVFAGGSSTLTLTGAGFLTANLVVNFTQSSDAIDEDVTVTPASDTSATVTVPAAVYNNLTAGNVVSITVTNSDGVESAAVTKTSLALPSGGTVTTSGSYRIHTFTSSGTFTNTVSSLSVEYVVVAGGGGGGRGQNPGGGGGAGGYRSSVSGESSGGGASAESALTLSTGGYTVTVGGGGAVDTDGDNSVFSTITSTGGGSGSPAGNLAGNSGGSGGGASYAGTGGAGTSGQGYAGGDTGGYSGGVYATGGGGGASAAGDAGNVSSGKSGNGGNGVSSSITGSAVTRAGGGGGSMYTSGTSGFGGSGGGGTGGSNSTDGTSATVNTGSGGGGYSIGNSGGAGGSGIVIVRYQV